MTENRNDQYRIPTASVVPGEVIKTYDLSGTLTAEQALEIARAVAGEAPGQLDTNNIDQSRVERHGTIGAATISSLTTAPIERSVVGSYDPTNLEQLRQVGAGVRAMRDWELAA